MARFSKDDLKQLDEQIDQSIGSETILCLPRDIALVNLLRVFEDYCRLFALRKGDFGDSASLLKLGQDGMQFAVKWIHAYCPRPTRKDIFELDFDSYGAAGRLHEAAMRYSTVWDLMAQLHRGAVFGERVDGAIRLKYEDPDAETFDTCSHFLASPDPPQFEKDLEKVIPGLDPSRLLSQFEVHRHHSGRIKYSVPEEVFAEIADIQRTVTTARWELGGDWDCGGFTLTQFREVWIALLTICWIHNAICFFSGVKGGALESVVKTMSRHGWEAELTRRSGVADDAVDAILADLTYDFSLYQAGNKQSDVTYQPFFCLRGELLALSNQLVMLSNAERNLWDLISIKRPEIHSRLRNQKEALWLQEMTPRLSDYGLRSYGPIKLVHHGQQSDLDLLVLHDRRRFALGLQLKWLNHPDRIRDVKYVDAELKKGLDQAELALHWLNDRPKTLCEITHLSLKELEGYEFKTAVLSKNTLGSTSTIRSGFPIVTERLLDWVLGEPHHSILSALWHVCEDRRYMPVRGEHFTDEDVAPEFGGIRFIGEKMGLRKLRKWDPSTDIDLIGLEVELQDAATV
jgi:hypothetical protein